MALLRTVGALLVALLLAGCAGGGPAPTDASDPSSSTTTTLEARAERPAWKLGQGWTYVVEVPGLPSRTFQMMVAEERGDLWVVATNDRQQAVHHVLYSTNPVLGRIGKETLSPYQSGAPVEMFRFPLEDGKQWTANFFGESMTFRATYAGDISLAGVDASGGLPKRVDGFRLVAQGPTKRVTYDYVEAVSWFTSFEVVQDGTPLIRLSLRDVEASYRGPYHFYRGAPESESLVRIIRGNGGLQQPESHDVPVGERFKDGVAMGVLYTGSTGTPAPKLALALKRPDGANALAREFTGARQLDFVGEAAAGNAATWKLEASKEGTFEAEVRVVGFSKFAEGNL